MKKKINYWNARYIWYRARRLSFLDSRVFTIVTELLRPQGRSGRMLKTGIRFSGPPARTNWILRYISNFRESKFLSTERVFSKILPPCTHYVTPGRLLQWTVTSDVTLTCCVDSGDCRAQQHWARCPQHDDADQTERPMWTAAVICLPRTFQSLPFSFPLFIRLFQSQLYSNNIDQQRYRLLN